MKPEKKTKAQLIEEIGELQKRVSELESINTQGENANQENEKHYRAIVEDQTEFIVRWKPDGTHTFVNQSYCRFFGKPYHELVGADFFPLIVEEERESLRENIKRLTPEFPAIEYENRAILPNGEIRWLEWVDRGIFDAEGRIIEIQSVGRDIQDRKLAEEAQRESEERFKLLAESIDQIFWLASPDETELYYVNLAYETIIGRPIESLYSDTWSWLEVLHPEDRQRVEDELEARGSGVHHDARDDEYRFFRPDGEMGWLWMQSEPVFDESGEVVARVVFATEVTERKKVEEELARSGEFNRRLVDASPVGIIYIDAEGNVTYKNPTIRRILGIPHDMESADPGRKDSDTLPVIEAIESLQPLIERSRAGETIVGEVLHYRSQKDQEIDLNIHAAPLMDEGGNWDGAIVMANDITVQAKAENDLRRRLLELTTLQAVSSVGVETLDEDELIGRVTQIIGDAIYPDHFGILLLDETRKGLRIHPTYRGIAERNKQMTIRLGEGIAGIVAKTGVPMRLNDVTQVEDYIPPDPAEFRSELCVPIKVGERVIGVINAEDKDVDAFTEDDERLLITVAGQLATALEKVRLFQVEQQQRRAAEAQREASAALTTSLELDQVLENILISLEKVVELDSSSIQLVEGMHLKIVSGKGYSAPEDVIGTKFPIDDPLFQSLVESKKPIIIPDTRKDWRYQGVSGAADVRCLIVVPLIDRGDIFGMLALDNKEDGAFTEQDAERAQIFANQAASAIVKSRLFTETRQRLERLQALHEIDRSITASIDLQMTLKVFLEQVTTQLSVDAAAVLLYRPATQTLEYASSRGFRTKALQHTRLRLGESYAGKAALERRTVAMEHLIEEETGFARSHRFSEESFVVYYGVPLIAKAELKGVLEIFHRSPLSSDQEWLDFMNTLATQAAIAIDNAELFDSLQRSHSELMLAYDTTLEGWALALELRDHETEGHSKRVTELTLNLARKFDMSDEQLVEVRRGALLHDIGKMGIPDSILQKPQSLTEEEMETMKQHPVYAYNLLSRVPFLKGALDIPYGHHEKWDGTGYPRGLKGEAIPLAARIFAVVDVWDALISDRPYRNAWTVEKATHYIEEQSGSHFDPNVVKVFFEILRDYLNDHSRLA
jgi:PAS domain S-box-containing protein/putative nucleotidyltransferase with HDIG domain